MFAFWVIPPESETDSSSDVKNDFNAGEGVFVKGMFLSLLMLAEGYVSEIGRVGSFRSTYVAVVGSFLADLHSKGSY